MAIKKTAFFFIELYFNNQHLLIRMFNYIDKVTMFNVYDDLFKTDTAFSLKSFILIKIPFIICHNGYL
jgi:hypothetical protein